MRAMITALCLAFALGGVATAVQAHCGGAHETKNDFETPPPAPVAKAPAENKG